MSKKARNTDDDITLATTVNKVLMTEQVKRRLKDLKAYARANPLSKTIMERILNGDLLPIGNNPEHRMLIPEGIMCVYSIEPTCDPDTLVKHLSVSVRCPKIGQWDYPLVPLLRYLVQLFDFDHGLESPKLIILPEEEGGLVAVNVIENLRAFH